MTRGIAYRVTGAAIAATLALGGTGRVAGNERPQADPRDWLPNTSDGIHLFADQLEPGYSDALVRFVATRYAGTQKMRREDNARFRRVNPRWVLLHYRLGSSSGPAAYVHGDRWSSDWDEVTRHEDWFLHNAEGRRHHEPTSNWDIHDLTHRGFREYWAGSVIADMRASGAQGVFADSFDAGVSGYGVTPPDARFAGPAPADPAAWAGGPTWRQQKADFMAYVADRFAAEPERFMFVPNVTLATTWWWPEYSRADGAMFEGFTLGLSPVDWRLAMNRALEFTRAGKFVIAQAYPRDAAERLFLLASYLLVKGRRTFINNAGAGVYFYPEYDVPIGGAVDPLPADIERYRWQGVYKREFADGLALVNPDDRAVSVGWTAPLRLVRPSGGGLVTDDSVRGGRYVGGTLTYEPVRALTLPARSAAVLLR
ncbi:MAG: hypothetical protein IT184_10285 [Acidobacteria bacterium]|nr:hypothetical protein [Acidobacteriota bacterium]